MTSVSELCLISFFLYLLIRLPALLWILYTVHLSQRRSIKTGVWCECGLSMAEAETLTSSHTDPQTRTVPCVDAAPGCSLRTNTIKHQILFHTERADHFVSLAHVSKMFLFCPILSCFMGSYSAALTVFCCISYLLNSSLLFLSCCKWLCYSSCRLQLL